MKTQGEAPDLPNTAQEPGDEESRHQAAEVLAKLGKLLDRLEKPAKKEKDSKVITWLNSSFTVTVLGGMLLALIGWGLQSMTNQHEKHMLEEKLTRETKEKVAFDFAGSFPMTLDLAQRIRSREIWLEEQRNVDRNVKEMYDDGRSFQETQKFYEGLGDQYVNRTPLASSCNQILAAFTNELVREYTTQLMTNFDGMLDAATREEVKVRFKQCGNVYRELTRHMFLEALPEK